MMEEHSGINSTSRLVQQDNTRMTPEDVCRDFLRNAVRNYTICDFHVINFKIPFESVQEAAGANINIRGLMKKLSE